MVSLAALSCPGAMEGGDASRVGEFTHYRTRVEGIVQVYRHTYSYIFLAHRADDEDPLTSPRFTTNKLPGCISFQVLEGTKKRIQTPICHLHCLFCLVCTIHSNTWVFDLKEEEIWMYYESGCCTFHLKTHLQIQLFNKKQFHSV